MESQQQVRAELDTCIELIEQMEHASEANSVMLMQTMDRLQQLQEIPSAGCDGQTAFAKKEDAQ